MEDIKTTKTYLKLVELFPSVLKDDEEPPKPPPTPAPAGGKPTDELLDVALPLNEVYQENMLEAFLRTQVKEHHLQTFLSLQAERDVLKATLIAKNNLQAQMVSPIVHQILKDELARTRAFLKDSEETRERYAFKLGYMGATTLPEGNAERDQLQAKKQPAPALVAAVPPEPSSAYDASMSTLPGLKEGDHADD